MQQIADSITEGLSWLLWLSIILCAALFVAALIIYALRASRYHRARYAHITRYPFWKVLSNPGIAGEYHLGRQLETFAPQAKILFNVYVPKADGTTSEIDALLILPTGIYVFENKNYSGWIFGRAQDKTWTQTLNRHTKHRFLNPILQNAGHVKALEAFTKLPESAFMPLVVFADKTTLKKVDAGDALVLKTSQVAKTLKRLVNERAARFTDKQMQMLFATLNGCAHASGRAKRDHIERIRAKSTR